MRRFIALCAPAAAALLGVLAASPAVPSDRATTVRFPPGATSITLRGAIRGYSGVDYLFDARAGQTLQMLFSPSSRSCYFNVWEPGASQAAHVGSFGSNEFGKTLALSGVYQAQVYLMRSAARRDVPLQSLDRNHRSARRCQRRRVRSDHAGHVQGRGGADVRGRAPKNLARRRHARSDGFPHRLDRRQGAGGRQEVALPLQKRSVLRPHHGDRAGRRIGRGRDQTGDVPHWRRRSIEPCPVVTFLLALVECGLPLMRVAPS